MRVFIVRCAPLLALAVACGCAMQTGGDERLGQSAEAVTVCASGTVVQGVDVSVYQGTVDWTSVKAAGIDFAIARISDGSALDTQFATNWSGMKNAGIVRGAYQYFEPGQDPTTQANIVVSAVAMLGSGDLPVTADMETAGGQSAATIVANLQTWMNAVKAGTGKQPMVYTASGYWNGSVGGSSAFGSDPLWVANWGVSCPGLPTGWSNWDFWQYSDTGTVNGISGNVDLDEFNGSLAQLQSFAGGASMAPAYGAQYVSQSWPLATTTMTMTTCQTVAATLTLKNTGTKAWDSNTRLGTTQPRDRASVFADATWVSTNRAAEVSGTVPPGGTYQFKFDFHAPPTPGTYNEFFGMVEDGVAWFSDPGQGGPPDNDIEAKIQVTAGSTNCTTDPGVDAGVPNDGGSKPPGDGGGVGLGGGDAGVQVDGGGGQPDGSGTRDGAQPSGANYDSSSSGCACASAGASERGTSAAAGMLFLALAIGGVARRRAR
jgi:lysozyme